MKTNITVKQLWAALSATEVEAGCRSLLGGTNPGEKKTSDAVLDALAEILRSRAKLVRARPVNENVADLMKHIRTPRFQCFHPAVIQSWLVYHCGAILNHFLEESGIRNNDTPSVAEPMAVTSSQFEPGLAYLLTSHKPRDAGLCLGYWYLFDGKSSSALGEACTNKGIRIDRLLKGEPPPPCPAELPAPADETRLPDPGDSDEFTTLDKWLISTAEASAFGESGAQSPKQVEDLLEEVVSLKAQRQHTLFHRGYLHALFSKPFVFHFPGETEERRMWYFTGVLCGLLRTNRDDDVLRVLKENKDLIGCLSQNKSVRSGRMLLYHVYRILWEAKEFGMCRRWIELQLTGSTRNCCTDLIWQIHNDASSLVRRGQSAEAEGFLNLLDELVRDVNGLPDGFAELFRPANDRKRAQVLQLKRNFQGAEALLRPLSEDGNALCDLALMRAGFRSLAAALPTKDEQSGVSIAAALERGKDLLEKAVSAHPASATNAHFCIGLLALLRKENTQAAADHLKAALAGMLNKEEAYSEGGLIQWTRFLLGVAILESTETADFESARDVIGQSFLTAIEFPLWLWNRAMKAAAVFDDHSLGQRIAEHLLNTRGADAYRAIWASGLASSVSSVRQVYLGWLEEDSLSVREKWEQLKSLLPTALRELNSQQGEFILDQMEGLADQEKRYRTEFLQLLEDDQNYSPAWTIDDALNVRIRLHELAGNLPDAAALLRERFFKLREAGGRGSPGEAVATLDWMDEIGADKNDLARLRALLPNVEEASEVEVCHLQTGKAVYILYIGGNETQKAHEAAIRSEFRAIYPVLTIDFFFPGWGSKWNVLLDQITPKILRADAVVLSNMVRTHCGRHVRAMCSSERPWFPCTGKGKKSLKDSIQSAAIWSALQKAK